MRYGSLAGPFQSPNRAEGGDGAKAAAWTEIDEVILSGVVFCALFLCAPSVFFSCKHVQARAPKKRAAANWRN